MSQGNEEESTHTLGSLINKSTFLGISFLFVFIRCTSDQSAEGAGGGIKIKDMQVQAGTARGMRKREQKEVVVG